VALFFFFFKLWEEESGAAFLLKWVQPISMGFRAPRAIPYFHRDSETRILSEVNFAQIKPLSYFSYLDTKTRQSIQVSSSAVLKDDSNNKSSKIFFAKNWIGFCASSATKCPKHLTLKSLIPFMVSLQNPKSF
jgi:hypothetical protein